MPGDRHRQSRWLVLVAFLAVLVARVLLAVGGVSSGYTWLFMSIALSVVAFVALAVTAFKPRRDNR
jgi:lipopolysaccharide export LptBFGC system permease protein LptF